MTPFEVVQATILTMLSAATIGLVIGLLYTFFGRK